MQKLLPFLFLILLTGCGAKKFYNLGHNLNIEHTHDYNQTIDVVSVKVPKYLKEHKIVRQVSPYQIELIDKAHWLIPMEKRLTHMLIDYLQQSMNNPHVHLYPWDSDKNTSIRVAVTIKHFIASSTEVILKANYKIMDLENKTKIIKLFTTSIEHNSNIESMMKAKEEAYLELLEKIKTTIINNK